MEQITSANSYSFSYIESGTGTPLIFVHGSLLDYRYWWREVASFSSGYRAIAFSRRHHFPSVPSGNFRYTTEEHINDTSAMLKKLSDEPVHLVGHSYGGYIATAMACRQPELLRSLTLIEPGGPIEGQVAGVSRIDDLTYAARLVAQGESTLGVAHFMNTVCGTPKWEDGSKTYQAMTLSNAITIAEQMKESRATLTASELSLITSPVLLMMGSRSLSPFPETLDRLETLIPNTTRVTIPNASHLVNVDNHEAFRKALGDFLVAR